MQDNFAYLLPFIMITFGVMFLGLQAIGFRPGRYWGLGYLSAASGFALPMVLTDNFLLVQAVLSNILFFSAFFFYGHALLVQFEVKTHVRARIGFAIAGFLAVSFFIFVQPNLRNGLATSDIMIALLLAPSVWLVRHKVRNVMDRILLASVALVVLETVTRVTLLLLMTSSTSMESLDTYLSSEYAYLVQFAASIFGFLMAVSVLGSAVAKVLEQHRFAAEHDPLTGLFNRRGFDLAAPDFRSPEPPKGVALMCDIDHFKTVNDRFGHATGDLVIIALAELLKERLPPNAKIARFGGEEFVAFVPDLHASEVAVLANMVRSAFSSRDWSGSNVLGQITSSFGISSLARGDHSIHDAISRADGFLYKAKENGRNQVVQEGIPLLYGSNSGIKLKAIKMPGS
ncbi:GGDEF domain-containing protein [Agrobacterium larrymoorei]|uniref:diguanylate cyclase n=1 Tax=Agrobacterium larrymoorei TaxID=160699 RepID=UPI0015724F60|nr:GGDEF domain-containing protein [Agrobacterium larrymoorei]